mgnify:CR=1 FL=1
MRRPSDFTVAAFALVSAAVLMMSADRAKALGVKPLADHFVK